jgi:Helix-turn-helix domain
MATQLPDPNVITLAEAAVLLRVSESEAYRMARAGDFPGVIEATRRSGSPRRWLVSVPKFNLEVHGTTNPGGSRSRGHLKAVGE